MKKLLISIACTLALFGCSDTDLASSNISKASDNFEVSRRVVFYNGITSEYMLIIEGLCSKGNDEKDNQISITCKTGPREYKKHFLGLSDNVTYFIEQLTSKPVGTYHYVVNFKPSIIVPDIKLR